MNDHLTLEELQALADGALAGGREVAARSHLALCVRCGQMLRRIQAFDRSMRDLPVERAPATLTRTVMGRIGIAPKPSLFLRAVGVLPYLFGLLVVLAVMLSIYVSTGVVSGPVTSRVSSLVAETSAPIQNIVERGVHSVGDLGRGLLSSVSMKGFLAAAIPILAGILLVAFVDRFLGKRLLGR